MLLPPPSSLLYPPSESESESPLSAESESYRVSTAPITEDKEEIDAVPIDKEVEEVS